MFETDFSITIQKIFTYKSHLFNFIVGNETSILPKATLKLKHTVQKNIYNTLRAFWNIFSTVYMNIQIVL